MQAANEIISALVTTQASFLVDDNPITSAIELPPIETTAFPHDLITTITAITGPPSQEEWNDIKSQKKLWQALASKEKSKG